MDYLKENKEAIINYVTEYTEAIVNYSKKNKVVVSIVAFIFLFTPIDDFNDSSSYFQGAKLYYSSSYNSGYGGGGSISEQNIHLCPDGSFARNGYSETAFGGMGYSESKLSGYGNWSINGNTLSLYWSDGDQSHYQFASNGNGYVFPNDQGWRILPNQAQCRY